MIWSSGRNDWNSLTNISITSVKFQTKAEQWQIKDFSGAGSMWTLRWEMNQYFSCFQWTQSLEVAWYHWHFFFREMDSFQAHVPQLLFYLKASKPLKLFLVHLFSLLEISAIKQICQLNILLSCSSSITNLSIFISLLWTWLKSLGLGMFHKSQFVLAFAFWSLIGAQVTLSINSISIFHKCSC